MSGFSDALIGRPSGILSLVHSSAMSKELGDMETKVVRSSIESNIGHIENSKEFFIRHGFGPKSVITMSMQQAPSEEISIRFEELMNTLVGNGKYEHKSIAKVHPYALFYNILWLSASVHRWTHHDNVEFMRKFIIPSEVIQLHFLDPERFMEQTLEVESEYANTGISFSSTDVANFDNVIKSGANPHRNIIDTFGMMAVRHMETRGDEIGKPMVNLENEDFDQHLSKEWDLAGLTKEEFKPMYAKYRSDAWKFRKDCLIQNQKTSNSGSRRRRRGSRSEEMKLTIKKTSKSAANCGLRVTKFGLTIRIKTRKR